MGLNIEKVFQMKPWQKVNHFPGMFQITIKTNLARNLQNLQKEFGKEYKFFPKTFILPTEYSEFTS